MNKLEQTRKRGTNTLIALAIIAVAVYVGFTPMYELINGGVAGAVIGASFGAIFVIILTMYLLNKQTEIEQESKKSERVFDEKVKLYYEIYNEIESMLNLLLMRVLAKYRWLEWACALMLESQAQHLMLWLMQKLISK